MSDSEDEPLSSRLSKRRQRIESDLSPTESQAHAHDFPPSIVSSNSSQESSDPVVEESKGGKARSRRLQRVFLGSDSSSESGEGKGGNRGVRGKDSKGRAAVRKANQKGWHQSKWQHSLVYS